mmetsp:Transcript_24303/g.58236  ORF Transcript_24303/g.58236 Transcript_24303/m.58236 type:complete len:809 (-) Transcript_24303:55-2481(-)
MDVGLVLPEGLHRLLRLGRPLLPVLLLRRQLRPLLRQRPLPLLRRQRAGGVLCEFLLQRLVPRQHPPEALPLPRQLLAERLLRPLERAEPLPQVREVALRLRVCDLGRRRLLPCRLELPLKHLSLLTSLHPHTLHLLHHRPHALLLPAPLPPGRGLGLGPVLAQQGAVGLGQQHAVHVPLLRDLLQPLLQQHPLVPYRVHLLERRLHLAPKLLPHLPLGLLRLLLLVPAQAPHHGKQLLVLRLEFLHVAEHNQLVRDHLLGVGRLGRHLWHLLLHGGRPPLPDEGPLDGRGREAVAELLRLPEEGAALQAEVRLLPLELRDLDHEALPLRCEHPVALRELLDLRQGALQPARRLLRCRLGRLALLPLLHNQRPLCLKLLHDGLETRLGPLPGPPLLLQKVARVLQHRVDLRHPPLPQKLARHLCGRRRQDLLEESRPLAPHGLRQGPRRAVQPRLQRRRRLLKLLDPRRSLALGVGQGRLGRLGVPLQGGHALVEGRVGRPERRHLVLEVLGSLLGQRAEPRLALKLLPERGLLSCVAARLLPPLLGQLVHLPQPLLRLRPPLSLRGGRPVRLPLELVALRLERRRLRLTRRLEPRKCVPNLPELPLTRLLRRLGVSSLAAASGQVALRLEALVPLVVELSHCLHPRLRLASDSLCEVCNFLLCPRHLLPPPVGRPLHLLLAARGVLHCRSGFGCFGGQLAETSLNIGKLGGLGGELCVEAVSLCGGFVLLPLQPLEFETCSDRLGLELVEALLVVDALRRRLGLGPLQIVEKGGERCGAFNRQCVLTLHQHGQILPAHRRRHPTAAA